MPIPKIKVGETWRLNHSRKGDLTIKFTSVDGEHVTGVIVEGRVRFASAYNNLCQNLDGRGMPGDEISVHSKFITLHEKIDDHPHTQTAQG